MATKYASPPRGNSRPRRAAQQQIVEVQDHFRFAGEGQFCPQRVRSIDRFVADFFDQLRQPRQVAAMPSGQASPLMVAQFRDRQRRHSGKHWRGGVNERTLEHRRAGLKHFNGLRAKRGQFAASQGHATGLLPQHMLAGFVRRFVLMIARRTADYRTYARPCRQHVRSVHLRLGNCCVQAASR